jgi:hypothetical protein
VSLDDHVVELLELGQAQDAITVDIEDGEDAVDVLRGNIGQAVVCEALLDLVLVQTTAVVRICTTKRFGGRPSVFWPRLLRTLDLFSRRQRRQLVRQVRLASARLQAPPALRRAGPSLPAVSLFLALSL